MKKLCNFLTFTTAICAALFICQISAHVSVGSKAPDFTLMDQDGTTHALIALRGKKVALCFYPADNTPKCTQEACSIRDNWHALQKNDIVVLGISSGDKSDKKHFADTQQLPFPLLKATDSVLDSYGVQGGFWQLYMPKRHTFLIDQQGIVIAIIKHVNVRNHAQQILDVFAQQK